MAERTMNDKADQLIVTIKGGDTLYVYGNAHIDGVWFDEHGRGHKYSYQRTPEGKTIKRRGKLPPSAESPER